MSELPELVVDREFDAPRELVWRTWTDPELLARWYGPNIETIIHKFDLQPDGEWHNEMKMGGRSMLQKVVFLEVEAPEKMVWHHYSSVDADWNVAANPMMPDWPQVLLTTVTFTESDGKTNVRLSQKPFEGSDDEIACFAKMMEMIKGGWGSGYVIMDEILAELQA